MSDIEILARVERRRKWTMQDETALLAEVEAAGGKVRLVARRHGISESVLYNWRAARQAAVSLMPAPTAFIPLGVFGGPGRGDTAMQRPLPEPGSPRAVRGRDSGAGGIEIVLPNGARVSVDALVNEKALSRVLRAMKGAT